MTRESFLDRDSRKLSKSHARAPKQERELAKRVGGKITPGSGCGIHQKGDVRKKGVLRIEAKCTKNKSFSVTREMVQKIEEASLPHGEMPVIVVEFLDDEGKPESELVIMPSYALESLLENSF